MTPLSESRQGWVLLHTVALPLDAETGKARRKNTRLECALPGWISRGRGRAQGVVKQLSRGGLLFACETLVEERQTHLRFTLGGAAIDAEVEVLYCRPQGRCAQVGVRFLRLGPGAVDRIAEHLLGPGAATTAKEAP